MGKKRRHATGAARTDVESANAYDDAKTLLSVRDHNALADSEDEFHAHRDEILLDEEPATKRLRKQAEQEQFLSDEDEEVLAGEASDEDEPVREDDEDEVEEDVGDLEADEDEIYGRRRQDADDEEGVLLSSWGADKREYYGGDKVETEQEMLEEEAEAKRIQQSRLSKMSDRDFGLDDVALEEADEKDEYSVGGKGTVTERLPQIQVTEDMSGEERMKLLRTRFPEFEPLLTEHHELQRTIASFRAAIDGGSASLGFPKDLHPIYRAKLYAAQAYLGALGIYFALFTSNATAGQNAVVTPAELQSHDIMEVLLQCREAWSKVQDLSLPKHVFAVSPPAVVRQSEAADDLPVEDSPDDQFDLVTEPRPDKRKDREVHEFTAIERASADRRAARMRALDVELAQLDDLAQMSNTSSKPVENSTSKFRKVFADGYGSDLGEEPGLTAAEAEEKLRHRKSLRFYTSQIAQKGLRNSRMGDNGGDIDVPRRERFRDRVARLNELAERRGKTKATEVEALDNEEDDDRVEEDDDYYDMVAKKSKERKQERTDRAEAYKQENLESRGQFAQEIIGSDGRREISYAIAKNKGLTPNRKKDVRNPRVKKRKKFEEKKKKLGSMKALYKGGEGRGGYAGELSGIKKSVVKSTKL